MSIKNKIFAAAATLTLVGGVSAAGAMSAGAATPSCGLNCLNIFSYEYGHHFDPGFVLDTFRQGSTAGTPIILFRTSDTDPAEDFTIADQDSVADFDAAGMVSPALALHYGCVPDGTPGGNFPDCTVGLNDEAFEFEYAPYGVDSGMCAGVGTTAGQGTKVALEPCGDSSKTVWVADAGDSVTVFAGYVPLINGSDTNFSHPYVLTYPKNGYPTDVPRPQLTTTALTGFSQGPSGPELGTVDDNQLWGADPGVVR